MTEAEAASASENEIRSLLAQHQALQENAETLLQQINSVSASRGEIEQAVYSIEHLEGVEAGRETLVPLGASSFVKASLTNPDKVLLGIGVGVTVEKERTSAKETLLKRKESLIKLEGDLKSRLEEVGRQLKKIEGIAQKMSQQQPPHQPSGTSGLDRLDV